MARVRRRPEGYYDALPAPVALIPPAFGPVIRTRRLVLRPVAPRDIDAIVATIGDLAVSRMLARVPYPYTPENAQSFVRFAQRNAAARKSLISAITLGGRVIGVVSIDAIPQRCRLGYWLGPASSGKGYGTEAVGALVAYAFAVLGVRLIRAGVFVDNPASRHLLAKLGFKGVGFRHGRSLARGAPVQHIATVLARVRFLETAR
jgi:RimJ/RimL family protein N-acetyltransferase